jgi:predicted nucleotidyltransferase component of viral defense system
MSKPKLYATPAAFRRALEDRLKLRSRTEGTDFQRLMREVAFDRLLCRLFAAKDAPWVLKGGYALELRIKEARATKDIDLALSRAMDPEDTPLKSAVHQKLAREAGRDLGDFFSFTVGEAMADLDAAPYGGARYPVEARLDGRTFVKFHVDVGAGDAVLAPFDTARSHDWLDFAGVPAGEFPAISLAQHFAEKIHAYTLQRRNPNSRVRDLVDMLLLIRSGGMRRAEILRALDATFKRRNTHPLPAALLPPPPVWTKTFAALAGASGLPVEMSEAFEVLDSFYAGLRQ